MMDLEILNMLNVESGNEIETGHHQDTEEQVMMAWEILDNSTVDNVEEEKRKANERKFEDVVEDELISKD